MEKIKIGIIQKPFGIKGELKVKSLSDFPDKRFYPGAIVNLDLNDKTRLLKIISVRKHQDSFLLRFEGLESLNDVEAFHQGILWIDKSSRHDLEEKSYYFDELEDCLVISAGKEIGRVTEVLDMPAHPVLRVNETILIPFNDVFVLDVDKEKAVIEVKWMEGLF